MKKLLPVAALPFLLVACTNTGSDQNNRPYTITIKSMGYKGDSSKVTITDADIQLFSAAGAPDIRSIDYTAVMYNSAGQIAGYNQSYIVPATGTLYGSARGGYICTTTASAACMMSSPDAVLVETGPSQWPQNQITRSIMPWEWAVIHNEASMAALDNPPGGDTAGWYTEFTFRAVQANGNTVTWKQRYQIIAPA